MMPKLSDKTINNFLKHQELVNELRQKAIKLILKVDKDVGEHKMKELIKKLKEPENV